MHDLIKESARGRHWTIASSNSTQTQVELNLDSTWTQLELNAVTVKQSPRRANLEPSRRESTGVDRNRVARRAAPCQDTSLMKISTSLGAILHKPDWNLHKPGSDSPQAQSPRATHPPRFVPKTFSFAYPTFSFAPTDFSEAGKRQFSGEGISRRRNAPHRQIRFPSIPVDSAPRARTPPPRGGHCGGFIETALPCESIHSP